MDYALSTCFGAPFFTRPAGVYAYLLIKRAKTNNTKIYLATTGETGGVYEDAKRLAIPGKSALINAIQANKIDMDNLDYIVRRNLFITKELQGVGSSNLDPRSCWVSLEDYDTECEPLCQTFKDNFTRSDVPQAIIDSRPN